jgi:hypothetical protein
MGKLLLRLLILAGLVACPVFAGQPHFSDTVAVTDANTNTAIDTLYRANSVLIINDGANEVYFDVATGVAVADGAPILPGESILITSGSGAYYITNVGLICDTGETASVRIFAFPSE